MTLKTKEKLMKCPLDELLALAMEEAAELIVELNKARRFGAGNWHPSDPTTNNRQRIKKEYYDLARTLDIWYKRTTSSKDILMHKDRAGMVE